MSSNTKSGFIDGKSGERILKLFNQLVAEDSMTLIRAQESDLLTTFNWANDRSIRAFSFNNEPITLAVHSSWYLNKIKDENCFYYLGVIDGKAIGSIRFDMSDKTALISYLIDPAYHNRGLGLLLLKKAVSRLILDTDHTVTIIVGRVMFANIASIKAFERLGYEKNIEHQSYKFVKKINYENRLI
jgi:UDP-2,4-diacetamido-2,4,6-trideoxy-beta-L-altropyranose hydrolase